MTQKDQLLEVLAAFSNRSALEMDTTAEHASRAALMDTLAVALGALTHPAASAARRYAVHTQVVRGATLWGSGLCVSAETATLVNGVPLRAYDYNDLYIGKGGGHPSDMIPGLVALAQWRGLSGTALLSAIALGVEVSLHLFDHVRLRVGGLDYPNIVAIAACCAAARLLQLSEAETREALSITVTPHQASYEVESNDLNERGDLTMWKRFNGSDAVRQAVYATLLAEAGVEGVVRPFEGKFGFLARLDIDPPALTALCEALKPVEKLTRITQTTYKRWPVGSRGQSAIQAALEARAGLEDTHQIASISIDTDEDVYDHLVTQRDAPWNPISRETADHSLPCIVATAILDGRIGTETFAAANVLNPERRQLLAKCVVEPSAELSGGMRKGFLTRVKIMETSGRTSIGEAKAPPGHWLQPFVDADFEDKLRDNVTPLFGKNRADDIITSVWHFATAEDLQALCRLTILDDLSSLEVGTSREIA